ncbi:MAG: hypothetical protein PW999_09905 [Paraburkholderia tropica]|nr:hypothetical protein [Paraburkholderia tropica]
MTRYLEILIEVSTGIFVGPFKNGFFGDLWKALTELASHLLMLFWWLVSLATYPVSVFVITGLAMYSEKKSAEAMRKAKQEYINNMHRVGRGK